MEDSLPAPAFPLAGGGGALAFFRMFDGAGTSDSSDSISKLSPSDSTTLALPRFLDVRVPVPEPEGTGANASAQGNDPVCTVGVSTCWCEVGLIGQGLGMGTGTGSSTGGSVQWQELKLCQSEISQTHQDQKAEY